MLKNLVAAARAQVQRVFPDPRIPVLLILIGYLALGFTVLGFNRTPAQVAVTSVSACLLEFALAWIFYRKLEFPLSALITSCGLSILLNYSHGYTLLLVPVFFAIGSKYVFSFQSRHFYNPALMGVALSLLFSRELITSAPAYQWNGLSSMAYFVLFPALMFFMPSINRTPLVGAFLLSYTVQIGLRAIIMRHHLPFTTLFFGTLSSPSFLLFTFFMITDPRTSPSAPREQVKVGVSLAAIDLIYHLRKSYYTFFYAALTLATIRLVTNHVRAARADAEGLGHYVRSRFWESGYYRRPLTLGLIGAFGYFLYQGVISPTMATTGLDWHFESVPAAASGIRAEWGSTYDLLDPRIQHIAKWILSAGDSVAAGDFDGDGKPDLFFSFPLKRAEDRAALYRNISKGPGDIRFERVPLPALAERNAHPEIYGLPTQALFVDYDNDGDLDLFISYAFGTPVLLRNMLKETGRADFVDVTHEVGLDVYSNSIAATFADFNRDGRLDLFLANVIPAELPDYDHPAPLNLFKLPPPEYPGDRRMFHFMHSSWNDADNGGVNQLFYQRPDGTFDHKNSVAMGIPDTRWSLAVGVVDLDHDGWPDIYVANDFGPDRLYFNEGGTHFRSHRGEIFGSVGRDTYKGMNVSIEDVDRNGWQDIYISNVHHDLQAEGSLLWMFGPPARGERTPTIEDRATELGALNERRFGWGAAIEDFDNDGWLDIAQANGMVDDSIDRKPDVKRDEDCPDYWYINEKVARSAPSIHSYADRWGDIRGSCIDGKELNRLYLNRGGSKAVPQFMDVASLVGMTEAGNSRGMAAVDLDGDGRMDLVVTHMFQGPTIYRNVWSPAAGSAARAPHWIGLTLRASAPCNAQGVGSQVTVGGQTREFQTVTGLSAQSDRRMHFGLGGDGGAVSVEVNWCGARREKFSGLAPDQYHELKMGLSSP